MPSATSRDRGEHLQRRMGDSAAAAARCSRVARRGDAAQGRAAVRLLQRARVRCGRDPARRASDARSGVAVRFAAHLLRNDATRRRDLRDAIHGAGRRAGGRALGELCRRHRVRDARDPGVRRHRDARRARLSPFLLCLVRPRVLHHRVRAQPKPLRLADHVGRRIRQPLCPAVAHLAAGRDGAARNARHGGADRGRYRADARVVFTWIKFGVLLVVARCADRAITRGSVLVRRDPARRHRDAASGCRKHRSARVARDGHRVPCCRSGPKRAVSRSRSGSPTQLRPRFRCSRLRPLRWRRSGSS